MFGSDIPQEIGSGSSTASLAQEVAPRRWNGVS